MEPDEYVHESGESVFVEVPWESPDDMAEKLRDIADYLEGDE